VSAEVPAAGAAPVEGATGAWVAPEAPVDVGLAGVRAHLDRLVARLGLRAITVVVDDPDLGRQAFRAGDGAIPPGLTGSGPGVLTEPATTSDDLDVDLLVALCAACLRVDVLRGSDDATGELALRRLPGVYAVAVERDDGLLLVRVHVANDAPDDLGRIAARELAPEDGVRLVVEIVRGEPAPASNQSSSLPSTPAATTASAPAGERASGPELLAVRSVPEDGEIEAHVAISGSRAVGRAPLARGLAGAVAAVLAGVTQVAPGLRWVPAWARTVETTADGHFVVAVALVDPTGADHRHGIATGTSPIEAAARATAGALD
jgi:hypothetical protein